MHGEKYLVFRNYKQFDILKFNKLMTDYFIKLHLPDNIELAWDLWYHTFIKCCNESASLKRIKVKNATNNFINDDIRKTMRYRDLLHRKAIQQNDLSVWNHYKRHHNLVSFMIQTSKREYFSQSVVNSNGCQKRMWQTLKIALNHNKYKSELPVSLAHYFTTVGSNLSASLPSNYDMPDCSNGSHGCRLKFTYISVESVTHELTNLGHKSNLDVLDLDSKLLCLSANVIAPSLCHLFNLSLFTGFVPTDWKKARVTPIFKGKGSNRDPSNYRPISIISRITKIMEKLV